MGSTPSQWRISRPTSPDGKLLIPTWDDQVAAKFRRENIDRPDVKRFLELLIALFEEHGYGAELKTPLGSYSVKPRCKRGDDVSPK